MTRVAMRNLVLVLGDQLTPTLASLAACDPARDLVLMCEVSEEATYAQHHKKKIILLFSAMRHFAEELRGLGWQVAYTRLNDSVNAGSFSGEVARAISEHKPKRIVVTEPGEWRVLEAMRSWPAKFQLPVDILADTRFINPIAGFAAWAEGRKQLRMEYFYRDMRRKTGLRQQILQHLFKTVLVGARPGLKIWHVYKLIRRSGFNPTGQVGLPRRGSCTPRVKPDLRVVTVAGKGF